MTEVDDVVAFDCKTSFENPVAAKNLATVTAAVNEAEKPKRKRSASKFVALLRTGECELREWAFGSTVEKVADMILDSKDEGEFVIACIRRKVRVSKKTKTVLEDVK
jgi:hypothetical protein